PPAYAARGSAPALRAALLRELPLPGAELEPVAPRRREGRVAPRRAVPPRRLHRHEPASLTQEGRRLLQRARHGGAVHQGGEARGEVDAAVVHDLPRQRGPAPTPRAGVQPRQLPPYPGAAGRDRAVVPDHAGGEGGQAGGEGDRARPLPRLPEGRGRRPPRVVRPPPHPNREAAAPRRDAMLTRPGLSSLPVEGRRAPAARPTTAIW